MLFWVLLFGLVGLGVGYYLEPIKCGGIINADSSGSGFITSPYYPSNYRNNMNCTWIIIAPPRHMITFEFDYFELQSIGFWRSIPPGCPFDYVVLLSILSDETEILERRYCTPRFLFPLPGSKENRLKVIFISDGSVTRKGFRAFYKVIPIPTGAPEITTDPMPTESSEITTDPMPTESSKITTDPMTTVHGLTSNLITATPEEIPNSVSNSTFAVTDTVAEYEFPNVVTEVIPTTSNNSLKASENISTSELDVHERLELSKERNVQWLLKVFKRKKPFEILPKVILALFLAKPNFFAEENKTSIELKDKLNIHILSQISRDVTLQSQDLALYVQALLVLCQDPRDFFGHNLVSHLRARVEHPSSIANPFEILALCNAEDSVSQRDAQRVLDAFNSRHRPFWTGVQAMAMMAMQCLSSKVTVRESLLMVMRKKLKERLSDGSIENLDTTALVMQALKDKGPSALEGLLRAQGEDGSWGGSIRKSFYILPAISGKSFLDIGNKHCSTITDREQDSSFQGTVGDKRVVRYSVWIGNEVEVGCTWKVQLPSKRNTTFYDLIEVVSKKKKHNVIYELVDEKPYVRALFGREDNPELGMFWFTYLRPKGYKETPTLMESSPVDVLVDLNQEYILWYKSEFGTESFYSLPGN